MKRLWVLAIAAWVCCGCASSENDASVDALPSEAPPGDMGGSSTAVDEFLADESEPTPEPAALTRLREIVEQDSEDAQAQRRLGVALKSIGRVDEALTHLKRAAELSPDDPGILLSLGIFYSSQRRFDDADTSYRRVLAIVPDHAKALNNLGNIALRRGNETGAIEWYRQAVEAEPEYVRARHKLAGVLRYYGHLRQAYDVYETIMATSPVEARDKQLLMDSLYNMAAINLTWNQAELAEEQLTRVVLTVPNHRSAHYARAQALLELGREDEAQQELQTHLRVLHASGEGF